MHKRPLPDYWQKSAEPTAPTAGLRVIVPDVCLHFKLDLPTLQEHLQDAGMKNDPAGTPVFISLPHPDGNFYQYRVYLNTTMHPGLAEKFPEIRSYDAVATNHSEYGQAGCNAAGFHAMILSPQESTIFIDPYSFGGGDLEHYMVYSRKDFRTTKEFQCANVSVENSIDVGQGELTPKSFGHL